MKNVNLAHGSLYMLGGYIGYETATLTGWWLLSFVVAFVVVAALGILLQIVVFRRMEGQDLKQTLVTIGISLVLADIMLWIWGGDFYTIETPAWLSGPMDLPLITGVSRRTGEFIYLTYPIVRLVILIAAIAIGVGMWLTLNRTKIGMLVRAGVDDRDMLSATGVRIQRVFVLVFAFGAGLAGHRGRHRRHLPVGRAGGGHPLPPRLAGGGDRRRHGLHSGRGAGRAPHRPRRAVRLGLRADLRGGADLPHHGGGARLPAAGPRRGAPLMAVVERDSAGRHTGRATPPPATSAASGGTSPASRSHFAVIGLILLIMPLIAGDFVLPPDRLLRA